MDTIVRLIFVLVPMIISLSVHECCHAMAARLLGDYTAMERGRLTLNPLPHIDIYGTLIIPGVAVIFGAPFFGWAKPVPVTPVNFTHRVTMRTGMMITAAAGPLSNLMFAVVLAAVAKVALVLNIQSQVVWLFLRFTFLINIILAIFNLIPLPPLDGASVLMGLVPAKYTHWIEFLTHNPYVVILGFVAIIAFGGRFIWPPVSFIGGLISRLFGVPPYLLAGF